MSDSPFNTYFSTRNNHYEYLYKIHKKTSNIFFTGKLVLDVEVSDIKIQIITIFGTAKSINTYIMAKNSLTPQKF